MWQRIYRWLGLGAAGPYELHPSPPRRQYSQCQRRSLGRRQRVPVLEFLEDRTAPSTVPLGDLAEGNAGQWAAFASDFADASVTNSTTNVVAGAQSLRFDTLSGFDTGVRLTSGADTWNLTGIYQLQFWTYSVNNTAIGFQGNQPIIILKSASGSYTYTPQTQDMPNHGWQEHDIPLAGSTASVRAATGTPDLANITTLEIHHDTWDYGFTVYYDGIFFDPTPTLTGDLTEGNAAQWTTFASDGKTTSVVNDATKAVTGSQSIRFDTQSGFDTGVRLTASPSTWDVSSYQQFEFWTFSVNDTPIGFQGNQPVVVLKSASGSYTYTPANQDMPNHGWKKHHIPLAGDATWVRTSSGTPDLAKITTLEIHQDTWDSGFTVYYDGVQFSTTAVSEPPPAGPSPPPGVQAGALAPKILLYAFDPIMENHGGLRLHQVYSWGNPVTLTQNAIGDLTTSSHGMYQPQIVQTVIADVHPYFKDGFQNTDASFDANWAARDFHSSSSFDYDRFIQENNLAARVDAGEIDEVWIYGPPIGGMYESVMAGQGAYWINGATQVAGQHVFPIMGLNYERGVAEAIHSFGHRVEGTMDHQYASLASTNNDAWQQYTRLDKNAPGQGGVGNVHFPVNGQSDYDYNNSLLVSSNAADWYNYPSFTGARQMVNADTWSPTHLDPQRDYLNWWYDHMPHFTGRAPDGRLSDWWRYIGDLDAFKYTYQDLRGTDGSGRVALTGINAGANVFGTISLGADTVIDGVVGRVDLYVDGVYQSSDTIGPFTFQLNTAAFSFGTHTIQMRAYEMQNGTETRSATVSVVKPVPVMTAFTAATPGGDSVTAGEWFVVTAQATDQYGNPVTNYSGPYNLSASATPPDPQGAFPTGTLAPSGFGYLLAKLKTAGTYTITTNAGSYSGTSPSLTVIPATASYFTLTVPAGAITGNAINVTVKAYDQFGNLATGYTGHVHFTSTDAAAALPAAPTLTSGVGIFPVTLKTPGDQKITATDTVATAPIITGTSAAITARGLTVTSFTPTATGFTVTFSKPFDPAKLTIYGPGNTTQDVTLIGAGGSIPISGTLIIDPTNSSVTFKATAIPLVFVNTVVNGGADSVVLPDDTYTVKLKSGAAGNGFFDVLGASLDGANSAGTAAYTTTFTTHYQASATPVLALPDFARGPDDSSIVKVPNNTAHGIPITLYNAAAVTDVSFALSYNPSLLAISAGSSADATDPASSLMLSAVSVNIDGTHATASFQYHNTSALSGKVVLGDLVATVPNAAKTNYKAKQLLQITGATVNGAAFTGVTAPGVHVNSYFGDVSGDGLIGAPDVNPMFNVAIGAGTGFAPYSLLDPVIVGDVANDVSVDGGDVATLKSYILHFSRPAIPTPPGLIGIVSPNAVDPVLSLTGGSQGNNNIISASVMLDHPHPDGSTGLTLAILALTYDPSVLSVSASDITFGSIPGLNSGWQLLPHVDPATGRIAVEMFGTTPLTSAQAGSLVHIDLHVLQGASAAATAVQLVDSVRMGQQFYGTTLADSQGGWILSPGMDRLVISTGVAPAPVVVPSVTGSLVASALNNGVVSNSPAKSLPEEPGEVSSLGQGFEANEVPTVMSNGAVAGDFAHGVPASLVVTAALAFQPSQPMADMQAAGVVFQVGTAPLVDPQIVDRVFLALFHGTAAHVALVDEVFAQVADEMAASTSAC